MDQQVESKIKQLPYHETLGLFACGKIGTLLEMTGLDEEQLNLELVSNWDHRHAAMVFLRLSKPPKDQAPNIIEGLFTRVTEEDDEDVRHELGQTLIALDPNITQRVIDEYQSQRRREIETGDGEITASEGIAQVLDAMGIDADDHAVDNED